MTQIASSEAHLARRLGLFDTTMLVMGGIIGSGIFINPYVVAQQVPSTILILAAWAFGGLIALAGAFIYAELSSQTSASGGQYVYLRDAFHPALAFVGLKMILRDVVEIPVPISLAAIVSTLTITILISLRATRKREARQRDSTP